MPRVAKLKLVFWTLTGLAVSVAVLRLLFGLGATTNLSDSVSWGLWTGLDKLTGIALAAGGFTVTATVYIFRLKRLYPIVRLAVLTAFLGYLGAVCALVIDLGLPWNIWHMIIYWNPHSPLFEVGWCVMLYLTVLILEFFPVPAEEFGALAKIRRFLIKIRLPLVIAGIGLSTLHQSSLGSLFLLAPHRLHPLWHSPLLPVLFLISAIALGLMAVTFYSHTTAYLYYRKPQTEILTALGTAARWVMILYVVIRLGDLAARGQLSSLAENEQHVWMFWIELSLMAVIPAVLLFINRIRRSRSGQWAVAAIGIFGVALNRINVGGLAHINRGEFTYVPSWREIVISLGIISAGMLAFLYVVERFKIWEKEPEGTGAVAKDSSAPTVFDKIGGSLPGRPLKSARALYSLVFILTASAGFALIRPEADVNRGTKPAPVHHARGSDPLWIDGNLDGFGVSFMHEVHQILNGEEESCVVCHHMNLPGDKDTPCGDCHSDMYRSSDAFKHDWHASPAGGDIPCYECHLEGETRSSDTAKSCQDCHEDLIRDGAEIEIRQYNAIGYVQAMHQLCIGCHADVSEDIARCAACHYETQDIVKPENVPSRSRRRIGKRLVIPPY